MVNRELTVMQAVYVFVALIIASGTAQAWEVRTTCWSSRFYSTSSCRTVGIDEPAPRDYAQEAEDLKLKQERIRKWESFCKPASVQDKFGVVRLVYAHENCDLGRSQ
jgi:hypothetical protein